jgi:hypothetical protein
MFFGKKNMIGKPNILMVINEILNENIRRMNVIDEAINLFHVSSIYGKCQFN